MEYTKQAFTFDIIKQEGFFAILFLVFYEFKKFTFSKLFMFYRQGNLQIIHTVYRGHNVIKAPAQKKYKIAIGGIVNSKFN